MDMATPTSLDTVRAYLVANTPAPAEPRDRMLDFWWAGIAYGRTPTIGDVAALMDRTKAARASVTAEVEKLGPGAPHFPASGATQFVLACAFGGMIAGFPSFLSDPAWRSAMDRARPLVEAP